MIQETKVEGSQRSYILTEEGKKCLIKSISVFAHKHQTIALSLERRRRNKRHKTQNISILGAAGLEYNKLTIELLAQGFTADNHPDYVKLPGCMPDKADPLKNYDGGFVYQGSYTDSLVYKTDCGKFVKVRNVLHDMGYMGIDWCHENDNSVLRCPYDNSECSRNNPLLHGTHVSVLRAQCWCECHKTAEPYDYQNSIKLANAECETEH